MPVLAQFSLSKKPNCEHQKVGCLYYFLSYVSFKLIFQDVKV